MSRPDPDFWRRRRVLVTGHTGFTGSWLCLLLLRLGAEVSGLSLGRRRDPALHDLLHLRAAIPATRTDIRDRRGVLAAVRDADPEIVLHLAAQPLVGQAYSDPVTTVETNVAGTAAVLDAVRRLGGVGVTVVVTSDKCYEPSAGNGVADGHSEDDRLGGADVYSASKAAAELVTDAFRRSYGAAVGRVVTVRAGNVFGGGDWTPGRLVPDALQAAAEGRSVALRRPDSVRPWQHVFNPIDGYLQLAQGLWTDAGLAGAMNFGPAPSDAIPVAELVRRLADLWGPGMRWHRQPAAGPLEVEQLRLSSARARQRLGWQPRWDLDAGLAAAVEWHRGWLGGSDLAALGRAHWDRYLSA